jgi:HD-GYP domain-containing protein (c-di-GMP phosphodiesterase class II)
MLKRVPVRSLQPGMVVQRLCGSWLDHPFWKNSFRLNDLADVQRVADSGVAEVWIDTDKGLDVPGALDHDQALAEVERSLVVAVTTPLPLMEPPQPKAPDAPSPVEIREHAKQAMGELFEDARMGRAIDPAACAPIVDDVMGSVAHNAGALLNVLRIKRRDEYTYLHSVAVCALMVALGRTLGFSDAQCREAGMAGLLHDIGKAVVPLDILAKPARLTEEEYRVMQAHASAGHALLRGARLEHAMALDVCLNHHEKVDGSGYPRRLAGREISLFAKMGAACDVYDAVTSNRPYKRGWNPGEAVREMAQWQGHFDPMVFQAFVKTVGIYPVGSLVRLRSQRLAMVVAQHPEALLTPVVQPLYLIAERRRLDEEPLLDLSAPGCGDAIVAAERPSEWALRGVEFDEPMLGWKIDE